MEDQINEQEALTVIRSTIQDTKESLKEKGWIYVIIGSVIMIGTLVNFVFIKTKTDTSTEITWIAIVVSAFISMGYAMPKYSKMNETIKKEAAGQFRGPLRSMWVGFAWVLMGIIIGPENFSKETVPVILLLMGMVSLISSSILISIPFKAGSSVALFLGLGAHILQVENQLILLTITALASFIIPGLILLSGKFKSSQF